MNTSTKSFDQKKKKKKKKKKKGVQDFFFWVKKHNIFIVFVSETKKREGRICIDVAM